MRIASRNLRLCVIYTVSQYTRLYWPYMFHLGTNVRGLSATEFGALKALYYLTVVLCEFPSGALADRWGRRSWLLVGALLNTVACGVYVAGTNFAEFAIAEVLFGFGTAAVTGAAPALLYESLQAESREGEFAQAQGRCFGAALVFSTVGLPLTDLFLVRAGDPVLAYAVTGGISLVGVVAALAMVEPTTIRAPSMRGAMLGALRDVARAPGLARVLLYSASVFALLRAVNAILSNPVLESAGIDLRGYGTVFAVGGLVGALAAWRAHAFMRHFGEAALVVALPLSLLAMYALLLLVSGPLAAGVLCTQGIASGALPVVVQVLLNRFIQTPESRASVLSLESLVSRGVYGVAAMSIGFSLDVWTLEMSLIVAVGVGSLPLLVLPFLPARGTRPVARP